jgi:hypothetical protein
LIDSGRSRRAEFFAGEHERRLSHPATGDERSMLLNVLGSHRATLGLKCAGLEGGLARLSVEPATLSLLGLIRYGVGSGRAPGARNPEPTDQEFSVLRGALTWRFGCCRILPETGRSAQTPDLGMQLFHPAALVDTPVPERATAQETGHR